jgi:hypothetical protein
VPVLRKEGGPELRKRYEQKQRATIGLVDTRGQNEVCLCIIQVSGTPLTFEQAQLIASYLEAQLPWLLTDDEVSGGDTVERLTRIRETLRNIPGPAVAADLQNYKSFCPTCSLKSTLKAVPTCPSCGTTLAPIVLKKAKKK